MNNVIDSVANVMQEDGFNFDQNPNSGAISLRIPGRVGILDVSIFVNENMNVLLLFVSSFYRVQPDRRGEIAELITRANYGLNIGCFELDMSDGEIRFRMSSFLDEVNITDSFIRRIIGVAATIYDHYLPEIMLVDFGEIDIDEAIYRTEARILDNESDVMH